MWDFLEQEILKNDPDIITINSSHYALDIDKNMDLKWSVR